MQELIKVIIVLLILYYSLHITRKMKEIKEKNNSCRICLSSLTTTETDSAIIPYATPCGHRFHYDCLIHWYVSNMKLLPVEFVHQPLRKDEKEHIYTCPLCRRSLRQDFFDNIMCQPDRYQYKKTFRGEKAGEPCAVKRPKECADICTAMQDCQAYRIDYHIPEDPLWCHLYQLSQSPVVVNKKNARAVKQASKQVIHNVCRKQGEENDNGLHQWKKFECLVVSTRKSGVLFGKTILSFVSTRILRLFLKLLKVDKDDVYSLLHNLQRKQPFVMMHSFILTVTGRLIIRHDAIMKQFHGSECIDVLSPSYEKYALCMNQDTHFYVTDQDVANNLIYKKYEPHAWINYFTISATLICYLDSKPLPKSFKIATGLYTSYTIMILFLYSVFRPFDSILTAVLTLSWIVYIISGLKTGIQSLVHLL